MLALMCFAFVLGARYGKATVAFPDTDTTTAVAEAALDTLSDWQVLEMAIAMTESRFNADAKGRSGDLGIFQITPIYAREASRLNKDKDYSHNDAADPSKAVEMFNVVQEYYNPKHDVNSAIKLHNPGGDSIGYSNKVKRNAEFIKRYEAARIVVKDYELRKSI